MKHKIIIALISAAALMLVAPVAHACPSCAGWGQDEAEREAVCASPSAGLRDALHACEKMKCSVECAAYDTSYDGCAASGPPCTITGSTQDCDYCRRGTAQWTGIGCETETNACSFDVTGCMTCSAWLHGGTDVDNLCEQAPPSPTSVDAAIGVSNCACIGGCSADCASACTLGYLDLPSANDACRLCLAWGACGSAFVSCSGI